MTSSWGRKETFDRKGKYPCKDCPDRKVGCHSTCEAFLKAKANADKIGESIYQKRSKESEISNYVVDRAIRIRKDSQFGGANKK